MDIYEETLQSLVKITVQDFQNSDESANDALSRIFTEYNNTLLTGVEKLHQTTRKEKNRWNNFLLWLEAKKVIAADKLEEEEKLKEFEEVCKLQKRLIEIIDLLIVKAKAKIELFEIDCKKLGNLLLQSRIKQLELINQASESTSQPSESTSK